MTGHPDYRTLRFLMECIANDCKEAMGLMKAEWPEGDISAQRQMLDIAVGLSTAKCSALSLLRELERKEGSE